jgi:DNA-binding NarL/FixJ family response regulator
MAGETSLGKHRVLIVDDHPIVCHGLAQLLNQNPDLEVCGSAGDVDEALEQIEATRPHVVIVDLALKSGNGIKLIELIKARGDAVKVLVSSMHDEALFAERALRAGAMGYVSKQEDTEKLIDAIRQVLQGEVYVSARVANRLLHSVVGGVPLEHDPIQGLTNREIEVFEMLGRGITTKQIARKLKLSPKTVESHREKIKTKLNLANSSELNRRAVQWVLENH